MGLIRSKNTTLTVEDDEALTKYLWKIIKEIIKTNIENKQNIIIEGCYIPFDWKKDFEEEYLKEIQYVCLIMTEEYIRNNYQDIIKYENIIEQRKQQESIDIENLIEENFIKLQKEKEDSDKRLLFTETIIGTIITISFLLMIFLSIFAIENIVWKVITMVISFVIFIIGVGTCLLIEQKAGYYQCDICKYKYIPSYKQVLFAMHSGRTRYMRCPKCHKKSWNKKVMD